MIAQFVTYKAKLSTWWADERSLEASSGYRTSDIQDQLWIYQEKYYIDVSFLIMICNGLKCKMFFNIPYTLPLLPRSYTETIVPTPESSPP